jgi:hypothetical protein
MDDDIVMNHDGINGNEGDNGDKSEELSGRPAKKPAKSKNLAKELNGGVKLAYPSDEKHDDPVGKLNCWDYKHCGREPGGENAVKHGVCPVANATSFNGLHGGKNAGRACWAVPSTLGDNKGSFASKIRNCTTCEFHQLVIKEEEKYHSAVSYMKKAKKEERARIFREPGFIKHIYAKSKHVAFEDSFEVDSIFITLLIGWVSLCPSVSFLEGSKRLCKDDLVDELMVIDAIADNPRRRAAKTVAKTMFHALRKQIGNYFDPLVKKTNIGKKR